MNNFGTEDTETLRRKAFQQLKPCCIAVSQNILTSRPNAQALTLALSNLYSNLQAVTRLDVNVLNNSLGDYVFFPLSHVFRQHQVLNDRALELGLQCLEILIQTCWRLNIATELAKQLLVLITFIVGGTISGAETDGKKKRSEETKLAGMRCLVALFGSLERTRKGILADVQYLPSVGHTITTVLGVLLESTSSVDLQVTALDAIAALLFRCVDDEDIIASFYPGVISGLVKVIGLGKTTKRPYQALRDTVKLLTRFVCRVLGDNQTSGLPPDESEAPVLTQGSLGTPRENDDLKVHRTTAWLKATSLNTKTALENILHLRTHPKGEVRKAVFELCRDLLELCTNTLTDANTPLVESMIVFSSDEDDQDLAKLAESTLHVSATLNQNTKEAIQASLHGWVVALPRVMGGSDEDAKTRLITRIAASFKLLTEVGLETDLLQDMLADNIRDSLIAVTSSSTGTEITLQPVNGRRLSLDILVNTSSIGGGKVAQFSDVVLGHRSQIGTVTSMKKLLALIGGSSETALALAQRHIRESSLNGALSSTKATSLWIAVQLLRGSLGSSAEVDEFFNFEFSPSFGLQQRVTEELFSVSLSVLSDATEAVTEDKSDSLDSVLQCLALESLSLIAQAQKKSFRADLVDALYPVVHLLGASSREVQTHAIVTLNNIAHFCVYSSAREMILDNVDYMINAAVLKLNTFDLSLQTPVVVGMMVKLAGASLVPYLDDMVNSIFSALDSFHGYEGLCEALFGVLGEIVEESAKTGELATITYGSERGGKRRGGRRKERNFLTIEEMVVMLRHDADQGRPRVEPLSEADDDLADGNTRELFPKEPWGKGEGKQRLEDLPDEKENESNLPENQVIRPTKSYELVQRITRLSQHYLTHDSPVLRMRLLRLVTTASPLLAENEDEFLPLVNDIWPVVINRLFEDESHVVVAAADAISQLSKCCGGFMTSRIKESWPGIKRSYIKAHRELDKERKIKSGSLGIYSPHFKKWDAFCRLLTSLAVNVSASDEIVDEMCEIIGAKILVERDDVREALEGVNADAVWLEIESWKFGNGNSPLSFKDLPLPTCRSREVEFVPIIF